MYIETPWGNNTQHYISTSGDSSDAVASLSQCLEAMGAWMEVKKLQLNPSKSGCGYAKLGIPETYQL